MRILVTTGKTQGQRKNDFNWTEEGEPIMFGSECDGEDVDGECGCRRAMAGVRSMKTSTTMLCVDIPMGKKKYARLIKNALDRGGWTKLMGEAEAQRHAEEDAEELIRIASYFTPGMIVERRGNDFQERGQIICRS